MALVCLLVRLMIDNIYLVLAVLAGLAALGLLWSLLIPRKVLTAAKSPGLVEFFLPESETGDTLVFTRPTNMVLGLGELDALSKVGRKDTTLIDGVNLVRIIPAHRYPAGICDD